jgi:hypothetical protein
MLDDFTILGQPTSLAQAKMMEMAEDPPEPPEDDGGGEHSALPVPSNDDWPLEEAA